jgi:hypothetical protein
MTATKTKTIVMPIKNHFMQEYSSLGSGSITYLRFCYEFIWFGSKTTT